MNKAAADLFETIIDLVAERVAARIPKTESAPAAIQPTQPLPLALTLQQVAEQLNISTSTVKRMIADGELAFVKIGTAPEPGKKDLRAIRIPLAAIHQFIEQKSLGGHRGQERGPCTCGSLPQRE